MTKKHNVSNLIDKNKVHASSRRRSKSKGGVKEARRSAYRAKVYMQNRAFA